VRHVRRIAVGFVLLAIFAGLIAVAVRFAPYALAAAWVLLLSWLIGKAVELISEALSMPQ
jgi:hypothetical protein